MAQKVLTVGVVANVNTAQTIQTTEPSSIATLLDNPENDSQDHKDDRTEEEKDSRDLTTKIAVIDHETYCIIPSNLDPSTDPDVITIVAISDTHNLHEDLHDLPDGDILVHAGDFSNNGTLRSMERYNQWIGKLIHDEHKYKYSILIAGNHDVTLDEPFYHRIGCHWGKKQNLKQCRNLVENGNFIYLEDNTVTLFGITFYGSPFSPLFGDWAFNLKRGAELKKEWAKIPDQGIDVLLTHGPPRYHGDLVGDVDYDCEYVGCFELLQRVIQLKHIQYHVFGHIHEGYGATKHNGVNTVFINASSVDDEYDICHKPIMFYVKGNRKEINNNL